jgi:hypothetical protein
VLKKEMMFLIGQKGKIPQLFVFKKSTSRPNDKEEMEKSYSCIMIFISRTRNILLASRVV